MSKYREFEVKKGSILYRRKKEFKSSIHLVGWKLYMKFKGYKIKEI